MKKPNAILQFFIFMCFIMGPIFLISGIMVQAGLLAVSEHSKGDPAVWFPVLGIGFLLVGTFIALFSVYQSRQREQLLLNGIPLQGIITGVTQLSWMRWGSQSPYVVYFSYEYEGTAYNGKSGLLWNIPIVYPNDNITVCIDSNDASRYATLF